MNRNQNSHFAMNPTRLDLPRSRMDRDQDIKFSFNVGDIIPFYWDEVLPGSTHQVKTSEVVRMQTLLTPIMDNIYLDIYYFFVPMRLTWSHTKEFFGENTTGPWIPQTEYEIPQVTSPDGGWNIGTIADYMGIPTGVSNLSVSALPFRAYALICNEWFRSEVVTDPIYITMDETTVSGSNGTDQVTDIEKGGAPFKAAKFFDQFTGCLPNPQKGPDVTIPVGNEDPLPVKALGDVIARGDLGTYNWDNSGTTVTDIQPVMYVDTQNASGTPRPIKAYYETINGSGTLVGSPSTTYPTTAAPLTLTAGQVPVNLFAIPSGIASMASINSLRQAFQIQKFYERRARGGTRYIETLKSMFGVTSPDSRLQRPEYLGGSRVPININQVVQNSGTASGTTPQGTMTAYSLTGNSHADFTRSFTEHGFIVGLCVARYDHSYQQGLERAWKRKDVFDFYWPVFANLGEQAVKNSEIYAQGSQAINLATGVAYDDEVFGYQEAWFDYRYKPSRVAGEMRSQATASLDLWHLGDDYSQLPSLSDAWMREDKTNLDRCLAVTSAVSNQLFADFLVKNRTTQPMPLYSIPGLIDHH